MLDTERRLLTLLHRFDVICCDVCTIDERLAQVFVKKKGKRKIEKRIASKVQGEERREDER